jgi:hypothetical protein
MEARSLSSRCDLSVDGGYDSAGRDRSSASLEGDFATGMRSSGLDVGMRCDFATGLRRAPVQQTIGDYAIGSCAPPTGGLVRGDFATGQHATRADTPSRHRQSGRRGPSLPRHAATVVEPGRP